LGREEKDSTRRRRGGGGGDARARRDAHHDAAVVTERNTPEGEAMKSATRAGERRRGVHISEEDGARREQVEKRHASWRAASTSILFSSVVRCS